MDTNNEILDAIEILADKKIGENITKVLTGICTSVNINKNTCVMNSNGVSGTVYFYGSPPEVNGLYRIFVPSNDMSRSFIIVPPKFTVNPNLLDNWYFGNPVNQRGLTEYTGNGYTVDRWKIDIDTGSGVSINNGLTIKNAGSYIGQYFDRLFDSLDGIPITGSIILSSGHLLTGTLIYKSIINQPQIFFSDSAGGVSMYVNALSNTLTQVELATLKDNVSILAAKLELGPTQTLAHREGDKWVLNEIPDFGEQLAKCQRYCRVYKAGEYLPALGYPETDGWYMQASLYIGGMRTTPVNNIGSGIDCSVSNIDGSDPIDKKIENWGIVGGTVQRLRISSSSGNDTKGPFPYNIMPKKDIIFSADL